MTTEIKNQKRKLSILTVALLSTVGMLALVAGIAFKANPTMAQVSTNAKNLAGLIAVDSVTGTNGAAFSTLGTQNLGGLIVLQGLFPTSSSATQNAKDLTALVAVNNTINGGANGAFTKGTTDLGGLIVLNNLFLDP